MLKTILITASKILNRSLKLLPKSTYYHFVRKMVSVPENIDKDVEIKVASTREELEGAFRVLHDAYLEEAFIKAHPEGIRPTKYHLQTNTSTIIVKRKSEVIGTLTIVRNGTLDLPIESIYTRKEIQQSVSNHSRYAEITCLAIKENERRQNGGEIFFPLLKFMYEYCVNYFGVETILIAIHPKDRFFYEGLLLFQPISENIIDDYMGAPAQGFFLNLIKAKQEYKNIYSSKSASNNLYHFFVEREVHQIKYPERKFFKINDNNVRRELIDYFFNKKSSILNEIDTNSLIQLIYNNPEIINVLNFQALKELPPMRRSVRHHVSLTAIATFSIPSQVDNHFIKVLDASREGIKFYSHTKFRDGECINLRIKIAPQIICSQKVQVKWNYNNNVYGAVILETDLLWKDYINYIDPFIEAGTEQSKKAN